ncbi:hypothetical protein H0A66_18485 [Alcaligenaceae bacterium]|nr:hypothetical protein [Alcaligenaceae bacterium]
MKSLTIIASILVSIAPEIAGATERDLKCQLSFTTTEWSIIYASAAGRGTVTCENGESMPVSISAKGIGLTAGKWEIQHGRGNFTDVATIDNVLGSYYGLSTNVGMVKAGSAQALTKGKVSLMLTGKGEGFDLGVAVSSFTIIKRAQTK